MSFRTRREVAAEGSLRTRQGLDLLRLLDRLTGTLPLRPNAYPFPLIVIERADPAAREPAQYLTALRMKADEAGIPVIAPDLGSGDPNAEARTMASTLLDTMSNPMVWTDASSRFGRFRFPRSDLVRSIEKIAVDTRDAAPNRSLDDMAIVAVHEWSDRASPLPWQRGSARIPAWWSTVGGTVAAVVAALATGIADQTRRSILLALILSVLLMWSAVIALSRRKVRLRLASQFGIGSRYRWLATSSFFGVLGGKGFDSTLRHVFSLLLSGDDEFLLQMKAFAFLEDVRAGYRKLTPGLRGFKRPFPPVVFLQNVARENGGMELLSVMSDIRSRRSEFHPLLVMASVRDEHRGDLDELTARPEGGVSPTDRYHIWLASLGTAQAPSQRVRLPWLLRIPVDAEEAYEAPSPALPARRRPRWTWLWSWRGLFALMVPVAFLTTYAHTQLQEQYCRVEFPFSWNAETRLRGGGGGSAQCVGVSTGGIRFERRGTSVGLDGAVRAPGPGDTGTRLTLAGLQDRIDRENTDVVKSRAPYVTVVYAGVFTAAAGKEGLVVSSVEQLAGAYLAQWHHNHNGSSGLKLRLLPANAGQDMAYAGDVADSIIRLARRDPTIVGVVGFGRNTASSHAAIGRLSNAGLPVVGTVNSSDDLPKLVNYHGLAATNHDEALALRGAVRTDLKRPQTGRVLIVHRQSEGSQDTYSSEIADDARDVLSPAPMDQVVYTGTDDIAYRVKMTCESAASSPYATVFFAGRTEDLPGLMDGLKQGGCTQHKITLLAGDDITKARFGTGSTGIPLEPQITVYHAAFFDLPPLISVKGGETSGFFDLARDLLGVGEPTAATTEPLLADGEMPLTYDATTALAQAANDAFSALSLTDPQPVRVPGSASVGSGATVIELGALRMQGAATGVIDFASDKPAMYGAGNRGLTVVKVAVQDGRPVSTPVCGQLSGGGPVPGLKPCPH